MTVMTSQEERREHLVALIRESGESVEGFAEIMGRRSSTLYRWLQGTRPIPDVVDRWMRNVGPVIVGEIYDDDV